MAVGRRPPTPGDSDGEPRSVTVDALANQLREVVKSGLINAHPPDDGALGEVVRQHARRHGYGDNADDLARALRDLIRDTLKAAEAGPDNDAARALLGATPETRIQPAAERRRIAADVLDIRPRTLRETYEPRIVRDLATRLYTAHHAPSITIASTSPAEPADTTGPAETQTTDAPGANQSGHRDEPDEITAAVIALFHDDDEPATERPDSTHTARIIAFPAAARDHLAGLARRVPRYRWDKALLVPATAAAIWARWGTAATLRFAGVLVIAGLLVVAIEVVRSRSGAASTLQVLYERVPRIILLALAGVLILNVTAARSDDEDATVDDPCLGLAGQTADECRPPGPPETTTTSPNAVPTTYVDPGPVHPAECPPAGNQERRLSYNDLPPMCINPDHGYTATFQTNYGDFDVALNASGATATVNNFVYLARWHYYDGVQLAGFPGDTRHPDSLYTAEPAASQDADQTPGYGMTLDYTPGAYPDDLDTVYMVATDPGFAERMVFVITPYAHQDAQNSGGDWPLVGIVNRCADIITDDLVSEEGRAVRTTDAPIIIETITITEHAQPTTTTSRRQDDICRDEQAGHPQPEDLDPFAPPAG